MILLDLIKAGVPINRARLLFGIAEPN